MAEPAVLVLDASVVAKWHLQDEELQDEASALRAAFGAGRLAVFMPDLARYEVANLLSLAWQRERLTSAAARQAAQDFHALGISFVATPELILDAMIAVERFGCSLYDAVYVSLAEQLSCDLVTADDRLLHRLQGRAPWVRWLGDYKPA